MVRGNYAKLRRCIPTRWRDGSRCSRSSWPSWRRSWPPRRRPSVRLGSSPPTPRFADASPLLAAFRRGLAERGWIEAKNVELVRRYSSGDRALLSATPDRAPAWTHRGRVDVRRRIARDATSTIPICSSALGPARRRRLSSRSATRQTSGHHRRRGRSRRPGLALLKQAAPTVSRVALLANRPRRSPRPTSRGGKRGPVARRHDSPAHWRSPRAARRLHGDAEGTR